MSNDPLYADPIRPRRQRDEGALLTGYSDKDVPFRGGRPDRPHVISIRWGGQGEDDPDAAQLKYNKTAGRGSRRRWTLWVFGACALMLLVWSYWGGKSNIVKEGIKNTTDTTEAIGPLQGPLPTSNVTVWTSRAEAVTAAFRHAWNGYEKHAWGFDELRPITRAPSTWMNVGMTIVDALDTAYIMGQEDIFDKALSWVTKDLKFSHNTDSNVFELTIRVLGGLLSAYHLSGGRHSSLLDRAKELGDILLVAFDTPTGLPLESINFATRKARAANSGIGPGSTAEVGTLAMEFKYLSYLTGDKKYWNAVQEVGRVLGSLEKTDGLVPIYVDTDSKGWKGREIRLGSRGDSYYEYLAKQYLLTNEEFYLTEYRKAVIGIRKHLLGLTAPNQLFFVGELPQGVSETPQRLHPKMDHLVCFLPGTLALLATRGQRVTTMAERFQMNEVDRLDLELAEELGTSCWEMYRQTATGLSPEIVYWRADDPTKQPTLAETELLKHQSGATGSRPPTHVDRYINGSLLTDIPVATLPIHAATIRPLIKKGIEIDFEIHAMDAHNLLRPETIESFFVLWRVTGNEIWREWGWTMFERFEKWAKVDGGYTSLNDVRKTPPPPRDKMETFFLGETLKYFYLLFSDEQGPRGVPLDKYVLNTEAHPFPKFDGKGIGTLI
ncbi:uncharacterized protein SPPG_01054 [Spizellomyces punctatus DAOM BR117]|uniref:alpha-1,2-Mannosidase n=1 Tax=Spizellomyces punctatus (strain DAOM BR117) TaxID=645134 RepID=A0A0L0HRU4_SPIPD|nr:uncharacterized protein SPPG_01054 [Spizellomyces punctatus DAOM BR117]KND03579.1 hypothetical protein SPPG_01054 [Spizellomyces punctatus DAOM BR117]|eukprot:XP_016611618.1 hypothetical protein SPPG_01054 [Spizellomyces punctatus DAOM BR117]